MLNIAAIGRGGLPLVEKVGGSIMMRAAIATCAIICNTCIDSGDVVAF